MPKKKIKDVTKVQLKFTPVKLSVKGLGMSFGIFCAVYVLFTSLASGLFPMNFHFFSEIYGWLGYNTTILGTLLGMIYGFIDGFVFGVIIAWLYNLCK